MKTRENSGITRENSGKTREDFTKKRENSHCLNEDLNKYKK